MSPNLGVRGVTYSSRNHIGLIFCSIPPSPSLGLAYRRHLIYMSVHPRGESCALHSPFEVPAALGGWATTEPGWTLLRAPTIPDILSRQASPSPGKPSGRGLALGKYPPHLGHRQSLAHLFPPTGPTQRQLEWLPWGPDLSGWSRGGEQSACQQREENRPSQVRNGDSHSQGADMFPHCQPVCYWGSSFLINHESCTAPLRFGAQP